MMLRLVGLVALALTATESLAKPPFGKSFADNDFTFITADDPNNLACVAFLGRDSRDMPDPQRRRNRLIDDAMIYQARFTDGVTIDIWADPALAPDAEIYAERLASAAGHLPTFLRDPIETMVINVDGNYAFAQPWADRVVFYANNVDLRSLENDLEELLFHEAIHIALDNTVQFTPQWRKAQLDDKDAITDYAAAAILREDLAESAIFAYTMIMTPDRLPASVKDTVITVMPHRFDILRTVFDADAPRFAQVAPAAPCE